MVFSIFLLTFLFIRPYRRLGVESTVMAAKLAVHDYRFILADTEMK